MVPTKTDLHNETEMDHLMVTAAEEPHPRLSPVPLETEELQELATRTSSLDASGNGWEENFSYSSLSAKHGSGPHCLAQLRS